MATSFAKWEMEIRRLRHEVNQGKNVEANYQALRDAQQQAATALLKEVGKSHPGGGMVLRIPFQHLRLLHRNDFPAGTIIRVLNYRIICNGQKTYATDDRQQGAIVPDSRMPQYLHQFIF